MAVGTRERLFRQWLEEHRAILLKVARARTASIEDQDDLLQEMLLQLWLSTASFRGDCRSSTWVYRVALNTSSSWSRRARRHRLRHRALVDEDCVPDRPDRRPDRAVVDHLCEVVRTLPAAESSLVLLYLDGLGYREMAEILGISENNVGVKLNRVKKKLFKLLRGVGHEC